MDNNEIERIKLEAKRRIKKAETLNLKKTFNYLFFNKIKYYPSKIKEEKAHKYVPDIITNAIELTKGNQQKISLTLKNRNYIFIFEEYFGSMPDGEYYTSGKMMLYFDNKKVLDLDASLEYDQYCLIAGEWSFWRINGFIEGEWVNDFKELKIKNRQADKKKDDDEQKNRIEEAQRLKKNFGI